MALGKNCTDREARTLVNLRRKQDLKEVIELVLSSPLKKGELITQADGVLSLEALSKANTDVQTRVVMQMAKNAATGDVRAARFLMEYAGKEPPKQQHITMELPTIIDDMTCRATPVVASAFAGRNESKEDEDSDDECPEDGA